MIRALALVILVTSSIAEAAPAPKHYDVTYRITRQANGVETMISEGRRVISDREAAQPLPEPEMPNKPDTRAIAFLHRPMAYVERSVQLVAQSVTAQLSRLGTSHANGLAAPAPTAPDLVFDKSGQRWTYRWTKADEPAGVVYELTATITPKKPSLKKTTEPHDDHRHPLGTDRSDRAKPDQPD